MWIVRIQISRFFFFFLLRSTDGHGGACSFFAFFQEKVDQGKDVVTKWRVVME